MQRGIGRHSSPLLAPRRTLTSCRWGCRAMIPHPGLASLMGTVEASLPLKRAFVICVLCQLSVLFSSCVSLQHVWFLAWGTVLSIPPCASAVAASVLESLGCCHLRDAHGVSFEFCAKRLSRYLLPSAAHRAKRLLGHVDLASIVSRPHCLHRHARACATPCA